MNTAKDQAYNIELHTHLFASWAASRATSFIKSPFSVKQGRTILERAQFDQRFTGLAALPPVGEIDDTHRHWRNNVIEAAKEHELRFTHGQAAKLINIYLKARFVTASLCHEPKVAQLHPPIDALLLKALRQADFGGRRKDWRAAEKIRWSKFDSDQYEHVIHCIRESLQGQPLWMIEQHWLGFQ